MDCEKDCCCQRCVDARKNKVAQIKAQLTPAAGLVTLTDPDEAIALLLEARDCYQERIKEIDAELAIWRDEA